MTYDWLDQQCQVCTRPLGVHRVAQDGGMPVCPVGVTRFTHPLLYRPAPAQPSICLCVCNACTSMGRHALAVHMLRPPPVPVQWQPQPAPPRTLWQGVREVVRLVLGKRHG